MEEKPSIKFTSKPQETTTDKFLDYIEKVIKMNMSEKKLPAESLFDLWKIYCDFYNCSVIKDDTFKANYEIIDQIYWKITESYQETRSDLETLSEIMSIIIKYRRGKFKKLNAIDDQSTNCNVGIIIDMCNHCHKLA